MSEEQKRLMVQNTVISYLTNIQQSNDISSAMMEDAVNKYLVLLKDQIAQELLLAIIPEKEEENGE